MLCSPCSWSIGTDTCWCQRSACAHFQCNPTAITAFPRKTRIETCCRRDSAYLFCSFLCAFFSTINSPLVAVGPCCRTGHPHTCSLIVVYVQADAKASGCNLFSMKFSLCGNLWARGFCLNCFCCSHAPKKCNACALASSKWYNLCNT